MKQKDFSTVPVLSKAQARVLEFVSERSFGWGVPVDSIEQSPLLEEGDSVLLVGLIKMRLLGYPCGASEPVCLTDFGERALARFWKKTHTVIPDAVPDAVPGGE